MSIGCSGPDESRVSGPRSLVGIELTIALFRFAGHRSDRFLIKCVQSWGDESSVAKRRVVGEQRPGDAGVLVGDGDERAVVASPLPLRQRPAGDAIGTALGAVQHRARALEEQRPEVGIALSRDMA